MGRGWVVCWVLSFVLSCECVESFGLGRAGRSCMSPAPLPGLVCLSCWSSAGEMKPRLRLSHCGLVDMSGEDKDDDRVQLGSPPTKIHPPLMSGPPFFAQSASCRCGRNSEAISSLTNTCLQRAYTLLPLVHSGNMLVTVKAERSLYHVVCRVRFEVSLSISTSSACEGVY